MNKRKTKFYSFYFHFAKLQPIRSIFVFIISLITWPISLIAKPYLNRIFVDRVSMGWDFESVVYPLACMFFVEVFANILNRLHNYVWLHFISKLKSDIRRYLFSYVHGHSYKYFLDVSSGELSQKLLSIATQSEFLITFFMDLLLPLALGIGITIFLTARISYLFASVFFLWFIVDFAIGVFLGPKALIASREYAKKEAALSGGVIDSVMNAMNVKIFSSPNIEMRHLYRLENEEIEAKKNTLKESLKIRSISNFVDALFFVFFFFILMISLKKGEITFGDFVLIYGLYSNFSRAISWMGTRVARVLESVGNANNNLEFVLSPYGIVDKEDAKRLEVKDGKISFKSVSLDYGEETDAITDLNLEIAPKEKIGLVGASGAGKSSLLKILIRFYESKGDIEIDDQNIRDVTQKSLRESISYVTQEPLLFSRSIRENISYSKENATQEEIVRAAKLADAHNFILSLDRGYDTLVGDRGSKLSGGQRQRVAIARAILKDAPILLMDEATSALDSETEKAIQKSMQHLMKGKSVIVIAHRLSTISNLDRLLVMDNGKIVEEGRHEELIKKGGKYSKLWKLQSDGFLQ